ncbi:MAG: CotH kinase family protein, partial [Bacteroidales bacterium]|nr:CotH kinase family protein [Bacteroidales bacterium]
GAKWYNKMFQDPSFVKEVKDRWNELYPKFLEIPDYVEEQIALLDGAQDRNFERWDILDKYVWPNAVWLGTYEAEVEFFLDFYTRRIEWLNKQLNAL